MMLAPSSEQSLRQEAPEVKIMHQDERCPSDAQFGIVNIPGVGMYTVGEYAATVTGHILGDEFDECEAALRYGTGYDAGENARLIHEFARENKLDTVLFFAHSFGGIASVDIINEYTERYPDADTKFAIAFFSSPAGQESLQALSWLMGRLYSTVPLSEDWVYAQTYVATMSQGGRSPFDPQVRKDIRKSANDTPAQLLHEQSKRLFQGMNRLSDKARVELYFIGDDRDGVVRTDTAPDDIARRTGRPVNEVIKMHYDDTRFMAHAGLWWAAYIENHRQPVIRAVEAAQADLGFNPKKPVPKKTSAWYFSRPV